MRIYSGVNRKVPCRVTLRTLIDQPYIQSLLLSIDPEKSAGGKSGLNTASLAVSYHSRRAEKTRRPFYVFQVLHSFLLF